MKIMLLCVPPAIQIALANTTITFGKAQLLVARGSAAGAVLLLKLVFLEQVTHDGFFKPPDSSNVTLGTNPGEAGWGRGGLRANPSATGWTV